MGEVEWFWKREDLYRQDGRCVYAEPCGKCTGECDPEHCETWDAFFDIECLADEILSE